MRIYIAHSREIDYVNNLYKPLRNDPFFNEYDLILPHETDKPNNTREDLADIWALMESMCREGLLMNLSRNGSCGIR